MGTAARIKARRERIGLDHKTVAAALDITESWYWDIEVHDHEIRDTLQFSQALALSRLLKTSLLELLGATEDLGKLQKASFEELSASLKQRLDGGALARDSMPWDVGDLLTDPKTGFEQPLIFLQDIAPLAGFDWRSFALNYQC